MNTRESDLEIIKQLYDGNHLNDDERERAYKLVYLLGQELKGRV